MKTTLTDRVLPFIEKKGTFTTKQLSSRFKIGKMQSAGVIARLSGKGVVEAADPTHDKNGVARWNYLG